MKIIIVRHGEFDGESRDPNPGLTQEGKNQSIVLANLLKSKIGLLDRVAILSSSANRALETAQIIADVINTEFSKPEPVQIKKEEYLWADNNRPAKYGWLVDFLRENQEKYSVVIIITHKPYVDSLPYSLGLQTTEACNNYAQGYYIDTKSREIFKIG